MKVSDIPPSLQSGCWRMKRASEKQYLNPMDCNSFQNACNFMTQGSLYETASQTPPYFAIRHPRLTHFPMNFPDSQLKSDITGVIYSPLIHRRRHQWPKRALKPLLTCTAYASQPCLRSSCIQPTLREAGHKLGR